jgi:hypothetical protein
LGVSAGREVASPVTMAWWKGKFLARVMLMWVLDEVFIGYYGGLCLTWEHLPWIDPTHPP